MRTEAKVVALLLMTGAVLATQLYSEGETDFLSVLDAQRSLHSSEDALSQSTRNVSADPIALYKALDGGWDVPAAGAH